MNKDVEIDVDVSNTGYRYSYSAFITLTQTDLQIFKTKKIKKFRLYIYDEKVNLIEADKFAVYVKCIMDKK